MKKYLVILFILFLSAKSFAGLFPDTGQTQSYTDTFGEDSDYTINPPSYTDLGNGVVRDNITGLEWQQSTAPSTYMWQQAVDYCNNLSLGGYDDWRLPTIKELATIADSSGVNPSINASYFLSTIGYYYWSSTTNARDSNIAWSVVFSWGGVVEHIKSNYGYVRAVRSGQNELFADSTLLENNNNSTITDVNTGLMWQQATTANKTWEEAISYCENLTLAGYTDWRVPTWKELHSIVDYTRYDPAIDITFFPDTVASVYWSSTTYAYIPSSAWNLYFFNGSSYDGPKSGSKYVRAVRGPVKVTTTTTTTIPSDWVTNLSNGHQYKLIECGNIWEACEEQAVNEGAHLVTINDATENAWLVETFGGEKHWIGLTDKDVEGTFTWISGEPLTYTKWASTDPNNAGPVGEDYVFMEGLGADWYDAANGSEYMSKAIIESIVDLIDLSTFTTSPRSGSIILNWFTESEIDNAGFNLYRSESENGEYTKINEALLPAEGSPTEGASYEYTDDGLQNRKTYWYKLEDIDLNGTATMHGPVKAIPRLVYGVREQ